MIRKSFRHISAVISFISAITPPIPALALRPQPARAGLEENFAPVRPEPTEGVGSTAEAVQSLAGYFRQLRPQWKQGDVLDLEIIGPTGRRMFQLEGWAAEWWPGSLQPYLAQVGIPEGSDIRWAVQSNGVGVASADPSRLIAQGTGSPASRDLYRVQVVPVAPLNGEQPLTPWKEIAPGIVVRPGPVQPEGLKEMMEIATDLQDRVLLSDRLRSAYGQEVPLIRLESISQALGKEVYLWREPKVLLPPSGSTKPRMLAVLWDAFLNGNKRSLKLLGISDLNEIWRVGTQSTGNHAKALGLWGLWMREANPRFSPEDKIPLPKILVYTGWNIPESKKKAIREWGAELVDRFDDYGYARREIRKRKTDPHFFYAEHGARWVTLGNMTSAVAFKRQVEKDPKLRGKRFTIVSASGAGGRISGWSAVFPGQVIAAETDRTDPVFEAVKAGRPVPVLPMDDPAEEDGIAVDEMEPEALELFHRTGAVVVEVPWQQQFADTHWVMNDLQRQGLSREDSISESVIGVSLGAVRKVLEQQPDLLRDSDIIVLDETGINLDPTLLPRILEAPLPALALTGLEETGRRVQEVLDERAWNQLKHFTGRMKEWDTAWTDPVQIAGVWADVDWTLTQPDRFDNRIPPSLEDSLVWILNQQGQVDLITGSPYRAVDLLDPNLHFPASIDERVVGAIRGRLIAPGDLQRLRVLARSGGIDVHFSPEGKEEIKTSTLHFSPREQLEISRHLAIAALHAVQRETGADLSQALRQMEEVPNVLAIAGILRDVEKAHDLLRFPEIAPLEVDGTMIFVTFKDHALNPADILAEAKRAIKPRTAIGLPIDFIQGPMYVAVSLLRKSEVFTRSLPEDAARTGLWIVVGDGPKDDLSMLVKAAQSPRLVLPLFVGNPEAVNSTDPVVIPHRRRFVEATDDFLAQAVRAAKEGKPYADLSFIAAEGTPRQLARALGVSLSKLSQEILSLDYAQVRERFQPSAGLEEAVIEPLTTETVLDTRDRQPLQVLLDQMEWDIRKPKLRDLEGGYRDGRFSFIARDPVSRRIAGLVSAHFPGSEKDTVEISFLVVDQDSRRNGIGRRLMEAVFEAAQRQPGVGRVMWDTPRRNGDAQKFYESLPGVRQIPRPTGTIGYQVRYERLLTPQDQGELLVDAGLEESPGNVQRALEFAGLMYSLKDPDRDVLKRFLEGRLSAVDAVDRMAQGPFAHLPDWGDRGRHAFLHPLPARRPEIQQKMIRDNAIAFLGALRATLPAPGLTLQEVHWMQSFLVGTTTPQELMHRFVRYADRLDRPLPWLTFERMVSEGLQVQLWAGSAQEYLENRDQVLSVMRPLRKEQVQIVSPETEKQIWLLGLTDAQEYARAWTLSNPVPVRPGESVDGLPPRKSRALPFPSAQGPVAESVFGSEDLSWEGYLSVDDLPIPPELEDLKSGSSIYLGGPDIPLEQAKMFALLLDRQVQVWGHYWVSAGGRNGTRRVEMRVKMRPVDVQRTESGLRIRFQAQIPPTQPVASPFVAQVQVNGERSALSLMEQKGWVRIISTQQVDGQPSPARLKELVAGGRLVNVVLGGLVRSIPMQRQELLPNLVHEALARSESSGETVLLFGNLGDGAGQPTARVDPGPLRDFVPSDYVNTPIQWIAVDPQEIWMGIRSGSAAAFVFEGDRSQAEAILDRAQETLSELGQAEKPLTNYAVKVEAQPNGLVRLFLAPNNPETLGPRWMVLAAQDLDAVELLPAQAGLATEQQIVDYGFKRMTHHPSRPGQKIEGPLIRPGDPLMGEPLGALALHGGILLESSPDAYHDAFFEHRVRWAVTQAGLASADDRLVAQENRWRQKSFGKPEDLARSKVAALVDQLLQPGADLETLVRVAEAFRDGGPRLRYEQGFRKLPVERQGEFNRKVWQMVQQAVRDQPGRVVLEPVFEPVERESAEPAGKRESGVVATGFNPTWDLIIGVERPDPSQGFPILRVRTKVGGPMAHIVQAVQRLSPSSTSRFAGPVGGAMGQVIRDSLKSQEIEVDGGSEDSEPRVSVIIARRGDEIRLVPVDSGAGTGWTGWIRSSRREAVASGRPWIIGDRLPDSIDLQMEIAKTLVSEIREAGRAGIPVYLSVHSSWRAAMIREVLAASPQNIFLSWEDLARLFPTENPAALREDPWKVAALADRLRIRHNISGAVLVSLGTAGFVLAEQEQWYAVPPAEFWFSYTTGATDSSLGVFLAALVRGLKPREALNSMAGAYAVYRGRPPEGRGLPPTWEEIEHGPIPRVQPIPNRLADILDEMGDFPSDGLASSVRSWWAKSSPELYRLLDERLSRPSERVAILRYLFQIEANYSNYPLHAIPLRAMLLHAALDSQPEVRNFARRQWLERERDVGSALAATLRKDFSETPVYRVEYDPALLTDHDAKELALIEATVKQAVEAAGGRVKFDWFDPSRPAEHGVRRVALLTPATARLAEPEGYRVLPMRWVHRPRETRLFSRAIALALTLASVPENPSADEARLGAVQRYFRFLGVTVSRAELLEYLSAQVSDERWMALVDRLTLNLTAIPLVPLLDQAFDDFLSEFAANLSA